MKNVLFFTLGAISSFLLSYLFAIRPLQSSVLMASNAIRNRHLAEASWLDRVAERLDNGDVLEARKQIAAHRTTLSMPEEAPEKH
jgi:hypothetical protein